MVQKIACSFVLHFTYVWCCREPNAEPAECWTFMHSPVEKYIYEMRWNDEDRIKKYENGNLVKIFKFFLLLWDSKMCKNSGFSTVMVVLRLRMRAIFRETDLFEIVFRHFSMWFCHVVSSSFILYSLESNKEF